MTCPGSHSPAPARASGTTTPCAKCGTRVALEPDPSGWGGAVYATHEGRPRSHAEGPSEALWAVCGRSGTGRCPAAPSWLTEGALVMAWRTATWRIPYCASSKRLANHYGVSVRTARRWLLNGRVPRAFRAPEGWWVPTLDLKDQS